MTVLPFHLRYCLTRSQRLGPMLQILGIRYCLIGLTLFALFAAATALSLHAGRKGWASVFLVMLFVVFHVWLRFFSVLLESLLFPRHKTDIIIDAGILGIRMGHGRIHCFLDTLTSIEKYRANLWTLRFANGLWVHIPLTEITQEQMNYIRAEMERPYAVRHPSEKKQQPSGAKSSRQFVNSKSNEKQKRGKAEARRQKRDSPTVLLFNATRGNSRKPPDFERGQN